MRSLSQQLQEKLNINPPEPEIEIVTNPRDVPMMYRAQISGRCGLQYGKNNQDLIDWTEQWINPQEEEDPQPLYQYPEPQLGLDGSIYSIKLEFPCRVFSNCGQDSIARPVMGKDGIPFIPGSSIKGLFCRLRDRETLSPESKEILKKYLPKDDPAMLRFHGAYPVGNWAATLSKVELETNKKLKDNQKEKIPYRIADVVHPQQPRQVEGKGKPQAIPIMSFYNPTFIFELSCTKTISLEKWQKIGGLLKTALQPGLGGKTSTGYGLFVQPQNTYPVSIRLKGTGVSSTLRGGTPEFRPNMFKAALRGHLNRLLAGVCSNKTKVSKKVSELFGSNESPGLANIYWNYEQKNLRRAHIGDEKTPVYEITGDLHLDVKVRNIENSKTRQEARVKDLKLLQYALQFAYTMGGIGKSWRRVWHKGITGWHPGFHPNYPKRAIGCHWEGDWTNNFNYQPNTITNIEELIGFLKELHEFCQEYMGQSTSNYLDWKEAWHPKRLKIYAQLVNKSELISLFHDNIFKTTLAIGGRQPGRDRPTSTSSVWHRMLPIEGSNLYLEIITLFTSNKSDWIREAENGEKENQLQSFITAIQNQVEGDESFNLIYGENKMISH